MHTALVMYTTTRTVSTEMGDNLPREHNLQFYISDTTMTLKQGQGL